MSEKVLGVLGGMGPAATAEFMRLLARDTPAKCDQDHPRVIVLSDAKIPDRVPAIMGTGEDPTPQIRKGLNQLIEWGAGVLAVPCNTAHFFIDNFKGELPAPFIHIIEETTAAAMKQSPNGAWLLSTTGTRKSGLYHKCARAKGYDFLDPPEVMQDAIQQCVVLVKAGKLAQAGADLRKIIEDLWRTDNKLVVTACTELPLAYAASGLPPEKEVSSLQALSDACIKVLYNQ